MSAPRLAFANSRVRLKARLRHGFAALSSLIGAAWLWRTLFARRGVRILAYHGVETPPSSPFSVSVESFENQISYLAEHFDVIDFRTFLKWRRGEYASAKPKVVLTFDDGLRNNAVFAAPILKKFALPATFFVIGTKIDGGDPDRYMTQGDALDLQASELFQMGSHSLTHVSVARIAEENRIEEIAESKDLLESLLGREVAYFCYPYGTLNDVDQRCVDTLERYGYALACTSINGVNFKSTNLFRLRRTKVEWSDDTKTFTRLLEGAMDGWFAADFFLRFLQRPSGRRASGRPGFDPQTG